MSSQITRGILLVRDLYVHGLHSSTQLWSSAFGGKLTRTREGSGGAKHCRGWHWTLQARCLDLNRVSGPSPLNNEVERRSTYKSGKSNQKERPKMKPRTESHGTKKSMNKRYSESQVEDNRCCISLSKTSSCPRPPTEGAWAGDLLQSRQRCGLKHPKFLSKLKKEEKKVGEWSLWPFATSQRGQAQAGGHVEARNVPAPARWA